MKKAKQLGRGRVLSDNSVSFGDVKSRLGQLAFKEHDRIAGDPLGVQTHEERAFDRRILEALRAEHRVNHPKVTDLVLSMSGLRRWWASQTEAQREAMRQAVRDSAPTT